MSLTLGGCVSGGHFDFTKIWQISKGKFYQNPKEYHGVIKKDLPEKVMYPFSPLQNCVKGWPILAGNYIFKINNWNTRTRCKICSKLTINKDTRTTPKCCGSFQCFPLLCRIYSGMLENIEINKNIIVK